jgi:hypothetical protein
VCKFFGKRDRELKNKKNESKAVPLNPSEK